jgi:hypothetical protein
MELLKLRDAAAILKVSYPTLKQWIVFFPSSPRRGGCAAKKYREATLARADGVVINIQHFVPHHPVCGASERDLLLMPQPPLLGEEGKKRLDSNAHCPENLFSTPLYFYLPGQRRHSIRTDNAVL